MDASSRRSAGSRPAGASIRHGELPETVKVISPPRASVSWIVSSTASTALLDLPFPRTLFAALPLLLALLL
jgi:hypothetical protein